jgi:hypothetical protein
VHPTSHSDASQAQVIDFFNETGRESVPGASDMRSDASKPRSRTCDVGSEESAHIGDVSVFRKAMRINVKGEDVADPVGRFSDLQVSPRSSGAVHGLTMFLDKSCCQALDVVSH